MPTHHWRQVLKKVGYYICEHCQMAMQKFPGPKGGEKVIFYTPRGREVANMGRRPRCTRTEV